jgi:hypothetical protein
MSPTCRVVKCTTVRGMRKSKIKTHVFEWLDKYAKPVTFIVRFSALELTFHLGLYEGLISKTHGIQVVFIRRRCVQSRARLVDDIQTAFENKIKTTVKASKAVLKPIKLQVIATQYYVAKLLVLIRTCKSHCTRNKTEIHALRPVKDQRNREEHFSNGN